MRNKLSLSFLGLIFAICGCGYTTTGSMLSTRIKTIHVAPIKNKVDFTKEEGRRRLYLPLLEVKVRNEIVDRFLIDGNLKSTERDVADLVLEASLIDYQRNALRYSDNQDVEEYRVSVILSMNLYDGETGELKWSEPSFAGEATYFTSGPLVTTEESAAEQAIEDLAKRVVERTIEDW